ncbi:MAG: hypothetical protein IJU96_02720 [Clostridia bacterium]|nr:hypothetical protein [Clostridia bacterium]
MERIISLSLILLLLFTACGAKQNKTEIVSVSCPAEPAEQTTAAQDRQPAEGSDETTNEAESGEEITAVSVPDTQEPPATEAPTKPQPTAAPRTELTTASEIPTSRTGTTITGAFIVKKVQGTLLTLHMYDPAKGGELKSGAYTADYGTLDGSDKMHFAVGDVVTIRYDQEIAETYPMQLTVREIYPAAWND